MMMRIKNKSPQRCYALLWTQYENHQEAEQGTSDAPPESRLLAFEMLGVSFIKFVDAASGIQDLLFTSEKRVTS